MGVCTYITYFSGLLSVLGLAIGLSFAPYRKKKDASMTPPPKLQQ